MFVWLLRLSFDHPSSLIIDHFCKYLHICMYIHVKAIIELFSISYLRSNTGDSVFPDLGTNERLDETVESSRRRHQRRYLDAQLDLIEGIVVSIALLSTFDTFACSNDRKFFTLIKRFLWNWNCVFGITRSLSHW